MVTFGFAIAAIAMPSGAALADNLSRLRVGPGYPVPQSSIEKRAAVDCKTGPAPLGWRARQDMHPSSWNPCVQGIPRISR
jgi:hypothetical protein